MGPNAYNLKDFSAQQVYDFVAEKLLKQGKKSAFGESCRYRFKDLKCAAGFLIPDEKYDPRMEGNSWQSLIRAYGVDSCHRNIIVGLQVIRDKVKVEDWPTALKDLVIKSALNSDIVDKVMGNCSDVSNNQ